MYFIAVIIFGSKTIANGLANFLTPVNKDSHIQLRNRRRVIFWIFFIYGLVQWWQNF
jgi:hypothetical protein